MTAENNWKEKGESRSSILESPRVVRRVAKLAGIDTKDMSLEEIKEAVVEAGDRIRENYPEPTRDYRKIKDPPYGTPLMRSVAAIFWDDFFKNMSESHRHR
jgi:hypothetical protein